MSSAHLPDILILILYLLSDIIILVLCSKLINMGLKLELKFLIMIVAVFTLINMSSDILFTMRWLLPLKYLFSFNVSSITDLIYNISLIFMAVALLIYNSSIRSRAIEDIKRKLTDTRLFVDDVIMHSPDAMCVFYPDGKVTLMNDPMLRLFKANRDDVMKGFNMFEHAASLFEDKDDIISRIRNGESVILPKVPMRGHDRSELECVSSFPVLPHCP
jgi:hypothetical protein